MSTINVEENEDDQSPVWPLQLVGLIRLSVFI